ncbi:MAG TPA: hypothetical protein IAC75_06995, partial [Candidatus Spyradosoma merdigallinarum]|nr:hypothetical protein [Candidatus Spyradosoma merdigallinarum]
MTSAQTSLPRRRPLFFRKAVDAAVGLFSIFAVAVAVGGMAWIICTVISRGLPA